MLCEEVRVLRAGHFSRTGYKVAVLNLSAPLHRANPHIMRWIREPHRGAFATHEFAQVGGCCGIPAEQVMPAELPQIFDLANGRAHRLRDVVGRVAVGVDEIAKRVSISAGSKPVISRLRSHSDSRTASSPSSAARRARSHPRVLGDLIIRKS